VLRYRQEFLRSYLTVNFWKFLDPRRHSRQSILPPCPPEEAKKKMSSYCRTALTNETRENKKQYFYDNYQVPTRNARILDNTLDTLITWAIL